jgi:hypothetical protein
VVWACREEGGAYCLQRCGEVKGLYTAVHAVFFMEELRRSIASFL